MVPVISKEGEALFPTKERRARALLSRKEAIAFWQKGIFCIKLTRPETEKREEYPKIALGVDPGSKREGYTVSTEKQVVLNITSNTPYWVKAHVETRRMLRRNRRYRKTPYRACRPNRASLRDARIPPSTRARWQAKLRIIKQLLKILPITHINVEDIQASTKPDQKKWNTSFSPLEVGKNWFYAELEKLGIILSKTQGYDTKAHRDSRGFVKSKAKLKYTWETHNVDSHSLCEIALKTQVKPFFGMYKVEFLEYHRRQLHKQNAAQGGIRKPYGSTVSLSMSRGSVIRYKTKLAYLGGTSKNKVAIHSIITRKRVKQFAKPGDIRMLHITKQRTQFLPWLKPWVSLCDFS